MRNDTVVRFRKKDEVLDPLTELLREGAQQLISQAVSTELELFLAHHRERRDAEGRRAVVRNGYLPAREVLTGIGPVTVQVPKVQQGSAFGSAILAALAAGEERGGYADVYTAMEHMMPKETVEYLPNPAHAAVYDTLFQEYERLHDYFGRGENPVLKKLAAIKAAAGG